MGRFLLPLGGDATRFDVLPAFLRGYVEAAFFCDAGPDAEDGLAEASFAELAPEALEAMAEDCALFQADNRHLLALAYAVPGYDAEQAGRDFWLTRCGHGAGFWDRGLGEAGDALSKRCGWRTPWGAVALYKGDDGRVYQGEG